MLAENAQGNMISQHYSRPEVRTVILGFAEPEGCFRGLNGDSGWYITNPNGQVRLRNAEDYDSTSGQFRTLYATLDVFDLSVKRISKEWDDDLKP
jgi:hypothetical protein